MTLSCFSWVCHDGAQRRDAAGFTLIELLVVIGIVGLLLAILLPAVQAARETARRMICSSKMKQIALAVHNYHNTHGVLPPAKFINTRASNNIDKHSIMTCLLPFIECSAIYEKYTFDENWGNQKNYSAVRNAIPLLGCPSVPHSLVRPCRRDTDETVIIDFHISDYATAEEIDRPVSKALEDAGLIQKRREYRSLLRPADNISKPFVSFSVAHDGLSQSFLLFEAAGRPYKYQGRRRGDPEVKTKEPIGGARWADAESGMWIDDLCGGGGQMTNCNNIQEIYAFHPGGTTISFADGGVRFIAETISPETFVSLFTCAAGDAASPP